MQRARARVALDICIMQPTSARLHADPRPLFVNARTWRRQLAVRYTGGCQADAHSRHASASLRPVGARRRDASNWLNTGRTGTRNQISSPKTARLKAEEPARRTQRPSAPCVATTGERLFSLRIMIVAFSKWCRSDEPILGPHELNENR